MNNPYDASAADFSDIADRTYRPGLFSLSGRIGRLRYIAYGLWAFCLYAVISQLTMRFMHAVPLAVFLYAPVIVLLPFLIAGMLLTGKLDHRPGSSVQY